MKSSLLEFFGGAFIFTALTYSTGKGYFNSYFRKISVDPSLVDLSVDQIFFEGGRQITLLLSESLVVFFTAAIFYLIFSFVLSFVIRRKVSGDYHEEIFGRLSSFKGLLLIGLFVWFSNFSFNSAMKSGEAVATKAGCIIVTVHSSDKNGEQSGCLVYKTVDNIWVKYSVKEQVMISIFPRDNFYRVDTVAPSNK